MQIFAALIWPAVALVFAGVFAGLWRADRVRVHLLGFSVGFFAVFLGLAVNLALPPLDPSITIPPLHIVVSLSAIAITWGAAKRLGQKMPLIAMLALTLASSIALFFALRSSELSIALLVQNGASGLLFAIGAVVLWTARSTDFLDRMLVATISLIAAVALARPITVLFLHVELASLVTRTEEPHAINVIVQALLTALLGGVLIAIVAKEAIEIRHKSERIDPVSGFLDQRTFENTCSLALANAQRLEMPVVLSVLEFDRFDTLQAKWGKDTIDRIIREISDVVRSWQRESDIIGRIGEHRIGVLFVGVGAKSAQAIVQNLRQDIDQILNDAAGSELRFTVSASIAQSETGTDINSLISSALKPLGTYQQLSPGVTFVNGLESQVAPLRRPTDDEFVTLG